MRQVTFKGTPFIFIGDSLAQSGALATADDYAHGRVSYAHWWPADDMVSRYGERIGGRVDLEDVGPVTIEVAKDVFWQGIFGRTWPWG